MTHWRVMMIVVLLALFSLSLQQTLKQLQVHVALTGRPFEYSIMCITHDDDGVTVDSSKGLIVQYKYKSTDSYTYNSTDFQSFTYTSAPFYSPTVHEVVLRASSYAKQIYYRIGIKRGDSYDYSKQFSFQVFDPLDDDSFSFLTYGDMDVTDESRQTMSHILDVINDGNKKDEPDRIHFIIHQGDIPYAWSEEKWDTWGEMMEPITSSIPYMVAPGNHESNYDFTSYKSRFTNSTSLNSQSPDGNLYYSFEYRSVHFIALSSEHPFGEGSRQYKWLESDLKKVNRRKTPFVITFSHRPQYSSNENHGSALDFRQSIEPLLVKYQVDLALFGHVHAYERTCPIVGDGVCGDEGVVNLCVGTAGYTSNPDWEAKPAWSEYRETSHGIAKIKVNGRKSLAISYLPNGEDRVGDYHVLYSRSDSHRQKVPIRIIDYEYEKIEHEPINDNDTV